MLRTLVLGGSMLLYVLGIGWCAVLLVLFIGGGGPERAWGLFMIFVLFPCFLWALGFGFLPSAASSPLGSPSTARRRAAPHQTH